jgi:hypothetical protein
MSKKNTNFIFCWRNLKKKRPGWGCWNKYITYSFFGFCFLVTFLLFPQKYTDWDNLVCLSLREQEEIFFTYFGSSWCNEKKYLSTILNIPRNKGHKFKCDFKKKRWPCCGNLQVCSVGLDDNRSWQGNKKQKRTWNKMK